MVEALPKIISAEKYLYIRTSIPLVVYKERILYFETLLDTARYSGIRQLNITKLKLSDIDFEEMTIHIEKQKNGWKNERQPIPEKLILQLKEHINKYHNYIKRNDGYIFFTWNRKRRNLPISCSSIKHFIDRLRKATGMNQTYISSTGKPRYILSFHTLRHLYLTEIAEAKGLRAAQIMGRHRSSQSTLRYDHPTLKRKHEILNETYDKQHSDNLVANELGEIKDLLKLYIKSQLEEQTIVT